MLEFAREQIIHEDAISYLSRGCQDVNKSDITEQELMPLESYVYYSSQVQTNDLSRFATELSYAYQGVKLAKLIAGLCVGSYIVSLSDINTRHLRLKTESFTTPDLPLNARIDTFMGLANYDSISDLFELYPQPFDTSYCGKNYDMGVRAMLAAGYFVLCDTIDSMNSLETEIWFKDAQKFYKDKNSKVEIPEYFKDLYM